MLHTVFYVSVARSIGQVDRIEFDEIGQRAHNARKVWVTKTD